MREFSRNSGCVSQTMVEQVNGLAAAVADLPVDASAPTIVGGEVQDKAQQASTTASLPGVEVSGNWKAIASFVEDFDNHLKILAQKHGVIVRKV